MTLKQQAIDALEFIPEITPLIRVQIAEKLGCHPRTVRRAHKTLLENREKDRLKVKHMTDLTSIGLYLHWFMNTKCVLKVEMKAIWKKRLNQISAKLETLRVEFDLDEKGVENKP